MALILAALLGACFGGPSPSPSSSPTLAPTPSPDPRLAEPAKAAEVYSKLVAAGLRLVGTNAQQGTEPQARINATYAGWPLAFVQYSSSAARARLAPLRAGAKPGAGDPAYTFAGLNIVIFWGPQRAGSLPAAADAKRVESARALARELDRLIGPLVERSASRVSPTAAPASPPASVPASP